MQFSSLIKDFLTRYQKEYDFYEQAGRLVAQLLESSLQAAGIRSIVTSRAKSIGRVDAKVRQRAPEEKYASVEEIFNDLVDLSGVRVALYFPGERSQVDSIIKGLFKVIEPVKEFPSVSKQAKYTKRFAGYGATHYRVQLREGVVADAHKRYCEARVEVQVASVLMHAWAEVEHDLVYKPLQGTLSEDEYAILDELNGLVMAGEIALESLQRAGETRVAVGGRVFSNHYDLASHLLTAAGKSLKGSPAEMALGRVDLLFSLLQRLNLATPDKLKPYVTALHGDIEKRPFAEQITDQLLAENESRYKVYEEVRANRTVPGDYGFGTRENLEPETENALGFFLSQWAAFERTVREKAKKKARKEQGSKHIMLGPSYRLLEHFRLLNNDVRQELEMIRRMRNNVVHGVEIFDADSLREAGERIKVITSRLKDEL